MRQSLTRSMWSMVGEPHEVLTTRKPRRHGKPWEVVEIRRAYRLHRLGKSIPTIASKLERSHNGVAWRLWRLDCVPGSVPIVADSGLRADVPVRIEVHPHDIEVITEYTPVGAVVELEYGRDTLQLKYLGATLLQRVHVELATGEALPYCRHPYIVYLVPSHDGT